MPIDTDSMHRARRSRWLELLVQAIVVVALVVALDMSSLLRAPNRLIQDALISLQGRDVSQSDVIIVCIDDKSIAALGQWPWRRAHHAALIDNIDKDAPRAIGMDVLFIEPDAHHANDDAVFADALSRSGKVVLPLIMQNRNGQPVVTEPIPVLMRSAKGLGHVHLAVDNDGVARNVYLREGLADHKWNHFSVAMLATEGESLEPRHLPGPSDVEADLQDPMSGQVIAWQRSHKMTVPFAGPPNHFRRVSYVDVLEGTVPAGTFKGKYVLIGATAAGLGDVYATPVSERSQLMSGVEIVANVLDSLLGNHRIAPAPAWLNAALNTLAVVLLALVGLVFLSPLLVLLLTILLTVALTAAAIASIMLFKLQFGPVAGMIGLGLTYASWSWRRLNTAIRYLIDEVTQLRLSDGMVPIPAADTASAGDFLDRRINLLKQAAQQLRDLHRFVSDSLEGLPDATLVCDRMGVVLLANAATARHFSFASGESLRGASVLSLMHDVLSRADHQPVVSATSFTQQPCAIVTAARDSRECDLLVKQAPLFGGSGMHTGWILSLVDVSEMRQAQRQRDDAMRFLGHDMRAPQASILTLLTLHRQSPSAMTEEQFHERIERHARKALALSDDFIQLVRAQSHAYLFERCNLADVLIECIDDAWETTQRRQIQIVMAPSLQEAESLIDRELVARAIGNLLGNALKFSPAGTSITCALESHESGWAVLVQDQGPGIAKDLQSQLFEPFARGRDGAQVDGAGLGLAFVKTVAQRHDGKVLLDSAPGRGSTFRLVFPRADSA